MVKATKKENVKLGHLEYLSSSLNAIPATNLRSAATVTDTFVEYLEECKKEKQTMTQIINGVKLLSKAYKKELKEREAKGLA